MRKTAVLCLVFLFSILAMPVTVFAASSRIRIEGLPPETVRVAVHFADGASRSCKKSRNAWQSSKCPYRAEEITAITFVTSSGCSVTLHGEALCIGQRKGGKIPVTLTLPREVAFTALHVYFAVSDTGERVKTGEVRIPFTGYAGGVVNCGEIKSLPNYASRKYTLKTVDPSLQLLLDGDGLVVRFDYERQTGSDVTYTILHEYYADFNMLAKDGVVRETRTGPVGEWIDVSSVAPKPSYKKHSYVRLETTPAEDVRLNAGHDGTLTVALRYCRTENLPEETAAPVVAAPVFTPKPQPSAVQDDLVIIEPNRGTAMQVEPQRSLTGAESLSLAVILAGLGLLTFFTLRWAARHRRLQARRSK